MLALATIAQVPPAPPTAAPRPGIQLPPGPADRAFAGVGPQLLAAALPGPAIPGVDDPIWRSAEPWKAWADAVSAEAQAASPDVHRRAKLARLALAQGRWDDAWDHFAATGAEPAICAALLPNFLPGIAAEAGPGGMVGALPDGVLLHPALPPPSVPAAQIQLGRSWIERREMRMEGLHVGTATLSMKVALESDGIQVEFEHKGGGAAHVSVVLPELADFEVRVAYIDWMRQDDVGGVLAVEVSPGDEPHTLFGRFRPRTISWPTNLPEGTPHALAANGLELSFPSDAPDAAMFDAACAAFASVIGFKVSNASAAPEIFPGIKIDLGDRSVARRKFLGLVSLSERFALRRLPH
jgi:hypothetical protein